MKPITATIAKVLFATLLGATSVCAFAEDWDALVKDVQKQMGGVDAGTASAQQTADSHPQITMAIRELDDAIRYLESSPQDFSGQKMKAIEDSRKALVSLRAALGADAAKK